MAHTQLAAVEPSVVTRATAGPDATVPRLLQVAVAAPAFPLILRRAATVLTVLGLGMIPWVVVLHTGLPATAQASHWAWTWTGLDSLEAVGLLTTGLLLRRGDHRACLAAAATSTLLLVDAWFDIMTAAPGSDLASAVLMAGCAELPLAVACAVLAIRTFPRPGR
ncbi:hypothetical protein [Kitasatospora sp. MAP5-34]|uniref:hypothetical protein n=1 Tax=Kitasatospora sp. MAP5-34 TaxID=3035102 RepID=UPI0024744C44|nr:hypothetical protein [Kitasatospora sp. MAP5-34]MDH6580222.1 hypothetical protein [Kitasatospora sp. MAP5-34]